MYTISISRDSQTVVPLHNTNLNIHNFFPYSARDYSSKNTMFTSPIFSVIFIFLIILSLDNFKSYVKKTYI